MSEQSDRVWAIIEKTRVGMLTTDFGDGLRARPMDARPDRRLGVIFFITDARSGKKGEIDAEHDVGLVFVNGNDKAYLSITGRGFVTRDHEKARAIWKKADAAWWHGPDDPNLRVLRVEPVVAELWDGPANEAVARYEFERARRTGETPDLGENRHFTVPMDR